jgi:hypothetical protein
MTAHETQPETMSATDVTDDAHRGAVPSSEPTFSEADTSAQPVHDSTDIRTGQSASAVEPSHASTGSDRSLFGDGDLSGFRSRWTEVQAAFVDDPRDCVQKADGLVADVVDRLTAGFSQARTGLEEQWSRGEQVSTEDLRLALQRYRDFFERLLAV